MNRKAIVQFLDAYRDGIIDEAAARELATVIRQGGATTEWVLQELALSGWISQALDTLDEKTFVHCFLTRLYAERSGDDFSRAFDEKVAAVRSAPRSGRGGSAQGRFPILGWFFSARTPDQAAGGQTAPARRRLRHWRLGAAGVFVAAITALCFMLTLSSPVPIAGTLLSATPGTAVDSSKKGTAIEPGMRLLRNDRVTVPRNGIAVIRAGHDNRFELRSGAVATLLPKPDQSSEATLYPDNTTIVLDSGELTAEHTAGPQSHPIVVATPHATAEAESVSRFVVTVTAASCRLQVDAGTVIFTRRRDGRTIPVDAGHSALATEAESFEVQPVMVERSER